MEEKNNLSKSKNNSKSPNRGQTTFLYSNKFVNADWNNPNTSDLFNLKGLFLQERNLRKMIRIDKTKKKLEIENTHLSTLKTKFEAYSQLYLTEAKNGKIENEEGKNKLSNKRKSFSYNNFKESSGPQNIRSKPTVVERLYYKKDSTNSSLDQIKKMSFNRTTQNVSDFMDKTKTIQLIKYAVSIKSERHLRANEAFKNEVDSYKDNFKAMNNAYQKEVNFLQTYDQYLKYLIFEKKKESLILSELEVQKQKLEGNIKAIENRMQRLNERLSSNKLFRNFIICIKEKKFHFDLIEYCKQFLMSNLIHSNIFYKHLFLHQSKKKKIDNKISKKSLKRNIVEISNDEVVGADQILKENLKTLATMNDKEIIDNYFNAKYIDNYNIYNHSSEISEELKKLEHENILLLNQYNNNNNIINELNKEYKELLIKSKTTLNHENNQLLENENLLKLLINKGKKLKDEKNFIENYGGSSNISNNLQNLKYLKSYSNKFFIKISEIYNFCCETKLGKIEEIIKKSDSTKNSLTSMSFIDNKNGLKKNKDSDLEKLSIIEKIIEYLKRSFSEIERLRKDDLKMIEFELEDERIKKKSRDAKKEELKRTKRLKEKVLQKMNKLYILPGRKVTGRYKLAEKNLKVTEKIDSKENCNLQLFLNYDDNDF